MPPDRPPPPALLRLLRPTQWTKNAVVLAAFFFARWDPTQAAHASGWVPLSWAIGAMLLFCLVSSGIYVLNDLRDRAADARHPLKRFRPLAAGEVTPATGAVLSALLLGVGLVGAWWLAPAFGQVVSAYVLLQVAYSFGLKRIALVDVFMIAVGFVLRAAGGAAVLAVRLSPWLLLCTFLLALFLALCKRRHEKVLLDEDDGAGHRQALGDYDLRLLDQLIGIAASATAVAYAMYTLSPETTQRFGTNRLGLTIPFVIFGIFRYLDLVYRREGGGRPEKTLLTDKVLMATIFLYGLAAVAIFLTVQR